MTSKQKWLIGGLSIAFLILLLLWMEMAVGLFDSPIAGN